MLRVGRGTINFLSEVMLIIEQIFQSLNPLCIEKLINSWFSIHNLGNQNRNIQEPTRSKFILILVPLHLHHIVRVFKKVLLQINWLGFFRYIILQTITSYFDLYKVTKIIVDDKVHCLLILPLWYKPLSLLSLMRTCFILPEIRVLIVENLYDFINFFFFVLL